MLRFRSSITPLSTFLTFSLNKERQGKVPVLLLTPHFKCRHKAKVLLSRTLVSNYIKIITYSKGSETHETLHKGWQTQTSVQVRRTVDSSLKGTAGTGLKFQDRRLTSADCRFQKDESYN